MDKGLNIGIDLRLLQNRSPKQGKTLPLMPLMGFDKRRTLIHS
jgi:hypothetical protein